MPNSLRPHGLQHARLPCPSPTPRAFSNSCPLLRWCHPTISSSVVLFSRFQSFPASGFVTSWTTREAPMKFIHNKTYLSNYYVIGPVTNVGNDKNKWNKEGYHNDWERILIVFLQLENIYLNMCMCYCINNCKLYGLTFIYAYIWTFCVCMYTNWTWKK